MRSPLTGRSPSAFALLLSLSLLLAAAASAAIGYRAGHPKLLRYFSVPRHSLLFWFFNVSLLPTNGSA